MKFVTCFPPLKYINILILEPLIMASQATPKPAGKAPSKSIASIKATKKSRKKAIDPSTGLVFKSAIKKCLKESVPDGTITITRNSLAVLCGISQSILEDIATLSAELAQKVHKKTIGGEEITSAVELMLTGELKKLCVREIKNTLSKVSQSKPSNK